MAIFANGTDGACFDNQCSLCKYGAKPCPITWVQYEYNYKQIGNKIATEMLNNLVKNDGSCTFYKMMHGEEQG